MDLADSVSRSGAKLQIYRGLYKFHCSFLALTFDFGLRSVRCDAVTMLPNHSIIAAIIHHLHQSFNPSLPESDTKRQLIVCKVE